MFLTIVYTALSDEEHFFFRFHFIENTRTSPIALCCYLVRYCPGDRTARMLMFKMRSCFLCISHFIWNIRSSPIVMPFGVILVSPDWIKRKHIRKKG